MLSEPSTPEVEVGCNVAKFLRVLTDVGVKESTLLNRRVKLDLQMFGLLWVKVLKNFRCKN